MKLTNEIVKTLEEIYFLAYLCTASKYGKPGARMVGLSISKDLSKIYIGNGRFNKAEKDLDENKNVMIVLCSLRSPLINHNIITFSFNFLVPSSGTFKSLFNRTEKTDT